MSNVDQELKRVATALSEISPERPNLDQEPKPFRIGRRRLVVAIATGAFLTVGTVAVAQLAPSNVEAACELPNGEAPGKECSDLMIPIFLDQITETGTVFEQEIAADGVVTRAEYDRAAQALESCALEAGFTDFEAFNPSQESRSTLERLFGFFTEDPEDGYHFRSSGSNPANADEALMECETAYFDHVHSLWHLQEVVANR